MRPPILSPLFALALLVAHLTASSARAHDPGLSTLTVRVDARAVELVLVAADGDLPAARVASRADCDATGVFTTSLFDDVERAARCARADAQHTALIAAFEGERALDLTLDLPLLATLARGHRTYVRVLDRHERVLFSRVLRAHDTLPSLRELSSHGVEAARPAFREFFELGAWHILMGFDHLLFLALLLLGSADLRRAALLVSCFTVAHSLALALATLEVLALPSRIVEAGIAATIVLVAVRTYRGSGSGERALSTFVFGLVHGLGFASALSEAGVGATGRDLAVPLLAFNLGVEATQLALAAVASLLYRALVRGANHRRVVRVSALAAVALGLLWFVDRALS